MNNLWDLSTFTNTMMENGGSEPWGGYVTAWEDTPADQRRIPGTPDSLRKRTWTTMHGKQPWSWVRDPRTPGVDPWNPNPGGRTPPRRMGTDIPQVPIIIVDYSNPAQTDAVTIGTH